MQIFYRLPSDDAAVKELARGIEICRQKTNATGPDCMTFEQALALLQENKATWLVSADGAANLVMFVEQKNDERFLYVLFAWGDFKKWFPAMREAAIRYAKNNNATYMAAGSPRKGWRKYLTVGKFSGQDYKEELNA